MNEIIELLIFRSFNITVKNIFKILEIISTTDKIILPVNSKLKN